jgi:hypothetical protein
MTVTKEEPFEGTFKPTFAIGDPLDFATGQPRCDPI